MKRRLAVDRDDRKRQLRRLAQRMPGRRSGVDAPAATSQQHVAHTSAKLAHRDRDSGGSERVERSQLGTLHFSARSTLVCTLLGKQLTRAPLFSFRRLFTLSLSGGGCELCLLRGFSGSGTCRILCCVFGGVFGVVVVLFVVILVVVLVVVVKVALGCEKLPTHWRQRESGKPYPMRGK